MRLTCGRFVSILIMPIRPAGRAGPLQQPKEINAIRRPMRAPQPVQKDGPRINEEIRAREVQFIDQTGHNHGPIDIRVALERAQEAGLDLVEIAPNSAPPVCKLLDYGKYKFQAQKK